MDRIQQMEVFAAINEAGSFVQAAQRLRISPPAVTRAMNALEDRLGVQLLTRTTRQMTLTDAGVTFLENTRRLLREIEDAELETTGDIGIAQGHLTVSTSTTFGRMIAAPIIRSFLADQPRVSVSLIAVDRVVNLVEEGIDVAVRIGQLPDSNLIAKRVGDVRRLFVASPGYLRRMGRPKHPLELKTHTIIGFTGIMPSHDWHYEADGKRGHLVLNPRFEVNDAASAISAATAGEGITMVLSYMVKHQIEAGELVPILSDNLRVAEPVHLVYPQSRNIAPKLRAFLDFCHEPLKSAVNMVDGF
jgi:DNA-binding transcriptional LysR family regulator